MATSLPAADHSKPSKAPDYVRRAKTGHVTNYDEAKVGSSVLPDPLQMPGGKHVASPEVWFDQRRPELLRLYESEVFGRVPPRAPAVRKEVLKSRDAVENGLGVREHFVLHFGSAADGPKSDVVLYRPAQAAGPVPVLLQIVFLRGLASEVPEPKPSDAAAKNVGATPETIETADPAEVLRRGYAYATFRYTDVQPDDRTTLQHGVIAEAYARGQTRPAPDEWGTISAWAWAASRVLDALSKDPALDPKRVALVGHSRLGKTVLWASASDPRFALVFASCSGEMGAALSRRDYGETIDDMAEVFPYWFAGNFQKFAGHWDQMPVDANVLIALSAPRPVFLTGGTGDQWADPKGEFLAAVAATPVYQLLGRKGLETTTFPAPDRPLLGGDIGWLYHSGPHATTTEDWHAFLDFADRHLKR